MMDGKRFAAVTVLVSSISFYVVPSFSFVVLPTRVGWGRTLEESFVCRQASKDTNKEPDLFEYFDPLLSPHAYPNGISPDQTSENSRINEEEKDRYDPLRLNTRFGSERNRDDRPVPTPDTFDPTLSPHCYPNGAPSKLVGDDKEEVDLLDVFDPTLSPHVYADGIPSTEKSASRRVGILLMDHGSRNKASNDRLHDLARTYQQKVGSDVIVQAAHMEIASPSVPEGLEKLLSANVDEIICHPFFLSPHGRHVSEDIPAIIDDAIQSLNIEIPIATTEPVGAHMDIMINAIHTIVQQSSTSLQQKEAKRR